MKKEFCFFKKINNSFPGSIFGLFSFGISLFTHLIGVLLYPNYDMTTMAISSLSDGYGGIIYRVGLILSGIIAIPFCVYLGKIFDNEDKKELIRKLALIGSIIVLSSITQWIMTLSIMLWVWVISSYMLYKQF